MLEEMRLPDVDRIYNAYPHQLSGGELHRAAIAQALVCRPNLVIADESTRSLDLATQAGILGLLADLNQQFQIAILFITHNPALLAGVCGPCTCHCRVVAWSSKGGSQKFSVNLSTPSPMNCWAWFSTTEALSELHHMTGVGAKRALAPALMRVERLSKRFVQRAPFSRKKFVIEALYAVDFEIQPYCMTAIVGESGRQIYLGGLHRFITKSGLWTNMV